MAQLSATERAKLPDSAFAYVDSRGNRRLPIHDASHVRNALARFGQVSFESETARQRARQRLLTAAKRHGIVPLGFIEAQLRTDRSQAAAGRVVIEASRIGTADELEAQLRKALGDPSLTMLRWSETEAVWTDRDGEPIGLPSSRSRSVLVVEAHGNPSTALVHDPSVLADPDLEEAVRSAIRLVVERERLQFAPPPRSLDPSRLPGGLVTFLFTDIEGSTELLTQLTDRYAGVLERVRRVIGQEVRRKGGHQVDVIGDETFSVFERAPSAVTAAVEIQRRLAGGRWPAGLPVRVRIGIHSGDATLTESGYVGISVNTAARVMAAGHGGQVLSTPATRDACPTGEGFTFTGLGTYRLKGLREPIELLQIDFEPGNEFPPLRAAGL